MQQTALVCSTVVQKSNAGCSCRVRIFNCTLRIPELNGISDCGNAVTFGASVTLSRLEEACRERMARMRPHETRVLAQVVEMPYNIYIYNIINYTILQIGRTHFIYIYIYTRVYI